MGGLKVNSISILHLGFMCFCIDLQISHSLCFLKICHLSTVSIQLHIIYWAAPNFCSYLAMLRGKRHCGRQYCLFPWTDSTRRRYFISYATNFYSFISKVRQWLRYIRMELRTIHKKLCFQILSEESVLPISNLCWYIYL